MTLARHHDALTQPGMHWCHEPIFLLAPARSYSTITLALLAGHPDIYGFPEMLLFTADGRGIAPRTAASIVAADQMGVALQAQRHPAGRR